MRQPDLHKHTLHLFEGDYDRLRDLFPDSDPAKVIRHLVRDLIQRMEGEKPKNVKVDI